MGQQQHQFTHDKRQGTSTKKEVPAEYHNFYLKWAADPNFLSSLLHENPTLTNNILHFFPHARDSYEDFLEMVFYVRSYDLRGEPKCEYVKNNFTSTTPLERFLMIILKLNRFEQLETLIINKEQMEDLFIELMKLFMAKPSKGFITKLSKYIGFKEVNEVSVKKYSESLREYLPHIQKHIKDYYTSKFKFVEENSFLLKNFKSEILQEDAVLLSMRVAELTNPEIKLLYEPRAHGMSFHSIQKNIVGYTGPWLLVVEHVEKDKEGQSHVFRFGSYQSGPILDVNSFQGDVRAFLFETEPKIRLYSVDNGQGGNNYYILNSKEDKHLRKGIGFGGNEHKENFKLWIDQDIDKSTVFNGHDKTYGFGSLVTPSTTNLNITRLEIWGLGSEKDLQNYQEYWESRGVEIEKRRKVNKAEFLQGDAGMMFENTFAHRDKVYGKIERTAEERSETKEFPSEKDSKKREEEKK